MRFLSFFTIGITLCTGVHSLAQSQLQLPVEASSCTIQNALTGNMNLRCKNATTNGPSRGIVLRLDQELNAQKAQDLGRTTTKIATTQKSTFKPSVTKINRNAAESKDGYFIQFAFASSKLEKRYIDHIARLATVLATPDMKNTCVRITGHTDIIGSHEYNKSLSEKRALAVAKLLAESNTISPDRIQIFSAGETRPLPDIKGSDPLNRRVEFATKDATNGCG